MGAEKHVNLEHQNDFAKEREVWERFVRVTARRQPPFGYVCKICGIFFPDDKACWRHLGKEIYVRKEERHAEAWRDKEERWGHEEEEMIAESKRRGQEDESDDDVCEAAEPPAEEG